jgi:cell division protein FtsI (penicillin-binding protein 3)
MDALLAGRRARMPALRDAHGNVMLSGGAGRFRPGASITLTIDSAVQFVAERALAEAIVKHRAKAGTALVLDVATSEVLAMANWPTFDPNAPSQATKKKARNRAVTDAFELGSVMKIFTVAAALEAGVVRPDTIIDVERGRFRVGRKVIRDSHHDWELDVGGIIKRSSNVGAVKIARRLGAELLHAALLRYGFGSPTGIELPGERAGVVRDPKRWGQIGLATISFGYGVTTTPLQVAAGFAAVGNDGMYHEPRIIKRVNDADGTLLFEHEPSGRRIMSVETARQMQAMLASVFDKGKRGGTARSVEVVGFRVGGKTGTAHKVDPATRKYSEDLYLSSFAGLAPIDDPRIAVLVVIDEPRGKDHYGALVAGPAFARITSETLRYLGVPPSGPPPEEAAPEQAHAASDTSQVDEGPSGSAAETPGAAALSAPLNTDPDDENAIPIPDFRGLGVAKALDLARELGLAVEIGGSGRAIAQVPQPGFAIAPVTIRIEFGPAGSR